MFSTKPSLAYALDISSVMILYIYIIRDTLREHVFFSHALVCIFKDNVYFFNNIHLL